MDMLCIAHKSDRRGFIQQANGTSLPLEQLGRLAGCSCDEARNLLRELEEAGVVSVDSSGILAVG
jgi:hypothetical protein